MKKNDKPNENNKVSETEQEVDVPEQSDVKKRKKFGKTKLLVATAAVAALLYAGDRIGVSKKVSNAYNKTYEYFVDVFTTDTGEYAQDFIRKVLDEKNPEKYSRELAEAMYVASESVPDSLAEIAIKTRIGNMEYENQFNILEHTIKSMLDKKTEDIGKKINEVYDKVEQFYKKLEKKVCANPDTTKQSFDNWLQNK